MKTIMKTLLVSIASLSLMLSVNAGELSVSGTAKATYNNSSGTAADQGLGVTNEINFTASGEMDNGYTWSYSMELDPASGGAANNDDTQIVLGLNDMGTIKVCVSECGNNKKYAWDNSAYTSMSDTGTSYGIVYPGDAGAAGTSTIQYHTPELPLGTTVSFAYNTNMAGDAASGNAAGSGGNSRDEYSIVSKPIDGLTLSAQYNSVNDYDDGVTTEQQQEEGGAYAAKYAVGNVTVGYGKSFQAPEITTVRVAGNDRGSAEYYENTGVSVGYAVNDDLSLSYTRETSERNLAHSPTVQYDVEMDSIQLAYSMGGATLSIARADVENANYEQNYDVEETIIAMSFAF
ncbi:porin [Pelagibacteraceae bacterium]|nr:porin [Pelagibacteraceae bacterium]